jgi:hypothetical protein
MKAPLIIHAKEGKLVRVLKQLISTPWRSMEGVDVHIRVFLTSAPAAGERPPSRQPPHPWYSLDRRPSRSKSRFGRYREEKILGLTETRTQTSQ